MKNKLKNKKILSILLSVAMLLSVGPIYALAAGGQDARAATVTHQVVQDGVTYTFVLNLNAHTAEWQDVVNPETPSVITPPSVIMYNGEEYPVTDIGFSEPFSSGKRDNVTGVILPNSLEQIRSGKFNKFPNLTELTIPGSVQSFTGSFQQCAKLKSLTFGEGVEVIDGNTMTKGCEELVEINLPSSLKELTQPSTFADATALEQITLPEGLVIKESSTFQGCTSLKSIELPESITTIPSWTFNGCTALTSVVAKGSVTSIGSHAFEECINLQEIPDLSQVTSMGAKAFYNCKKLSCAVDLSSINQIPDYLFSYSSITDVTLSDQLETIGIWAFLGTNITEIELPETLKSIGSYAFWCCYYLEGEVSIPDSVITVGANAFEYTAITEFHIGSGLKEIAEGAFASDNLQKITFNNSSDDILNAANLPDGVEIKYLVPAIGDVGDKISDEQNALTLQEAVNKAADGEVIVIQKDVKLNEMLTVPSGKNITIRSEEAYTIIGNKEKNLKKLITVEAGSTVKLAGRITVLGRYNSESTIQSKGVLILDENVAVSRGKIVDGNMGIIDIDGAQAELIMLGGRIEENDITCEYSGVIYVHDGAKIFVRGGTIENNKVSDKSCKESSSGILIVSGGSGEMLGGTIAKNDANRGSAILLSSRERNEKVTFKLSNGLITQNTCSGDEASGAVHVQGCAELTMTGGEISQNQGGNGAGVCVVDNEEEFGTTFTMEDGRITGNQAATGGGIYSYSNYVYLKGGEISDNTARNMGGGVYSEGNKDLYRTLRMENVAITNNEASIQGGGLWLCPTGVAEAYVKNGGIIWQNTAAGAGDDVVSTGKSSDNYHLTLASRVLGGGKVLWYRDGAVYQAVQGAFYPTVNPSTPRYDVETVQMTVENSNANIALKAIMDPSTAELAKSKAKLIITGNRAQYGAGIGANGGIVIGETTSELKKISVTKKWEHGNNPEENRPVSITVKLMCGNIVMDTLVLDKDNRWAGTFEDLLPDLEYTLVEEPVEGYRAQISQDSQGNFTIVNRFIPLTGNLTVSKTVTGNEGDTNKEFNFTVTLGDTSVSGTYGNMSFLSGVAIFKLKHGESKTATGLPANITYEVIEAEANQDGYATTSTGAKGTIPGNGIASASFVNTKNGYTPVPDPKTGGLLVAKTVSSNAGDQTKPFTFTVNLGDTSIEGKYGDMTFHAGVAEFTLKHGQSMKATGLPAGIRYTVTESDNAEYTVTSSGEEGVIEAGKTAIASFINFKNKPDIPDTPDDPNTPDTPDDPDKPNLPDKPDPDRPPGVNTGDESMLIQYLLLFMTSFCALLVIVLYRHKAKRR